MAYSAGMRLKTAEDVGREYAEEDCIDIRTKTVGRRFIEAALQAQRSAENPS